MTSLPRNSNGNGTTSQACAACKHQRRKCVRDCILAPFFPHDRERQFQNAHKLFGVSNITKIIKPLGPYEREQAMRTIIFQSDCRASDPVYGCYGYIRRLHRLIEYAQAELDLVLHQLAICKAQAQQQQLPEPPDHHHRSGGVQYLPAYQEPSLVGLPESHPVGEDVSLWGVQEHQSLSSSPSLHVKRESISDQFDEIQPEASGQREDEDGAFHDIQKILHPVPNEIAFGESDEVTLKVDVLFTDNSSDSFQGVEDHNSSTLLTLTNYGALA